MSSRPDPLEPCTACGACCADRRVVFHASECEDAGGLVPAALAGEATDALRCMEGTDRAPPRCLALRGTIGRQVRCAIYELRPSPCREFAPHGVLGVANEACSDARARHGLPALPYPHP